MAVFVVGLILLRHGQIFCSDSIDQRVKPDRKYSRDLCKVSSSFLSSCNVSCITVGHGWTSFSLVSSTRQLNMSEDIEPPVHRVGA